MDPVYEWTVDGTVAGPNAPEFITNTLQDGAEVSCRISVQGECLTTNLVETVPVQMQVNDLITPHIEIDANTDRACDGSSVTFTATGDYWGPAPVFQWLVNGETVHTDQPELHLPEIHAGHTISCLVVSSLACTTSDTAEAVAAPVEVQPLELTVIEVAVEHCEKADGFVEVCYRRRF